jgi:DinB superfamily
MSALTSLIDQYVAGAAELRAAVAGMSREQLVARPIAGKLSTLEVVCHLADFDPIHADRMKRVIAEERPILVGADENRFLAALAYHDRDLEDEVTIVERTRSQLARILRKLPEAAFQRVGNHTELGTRTLEQLLAGCSNHIAHHVRFIHDKRRALGLK